MNFKIGDRVVIVRSPAPERIGMTATVIGGPEEFTGCEPGPGSWGGHVSAGTQMYTLDIPPSDGTRHKCCYPPSHLELYRDDGNERGEWTPELLKLCSGKPVSA